MPNELQLSQIQLSDGLAPWFSIASNNKKASIIHLSAANGFPAASYHSFLQHLNGCYSFSGMDCRGSWPSISTPSKHFSMHHFADDLIEGLSRQHDQAVIGLGHSQGGLVTLLAAIKRPDLFSKLILIEPASLPYSWIDHLYPYIPNAVLYKLFPFMLGSLNRQRIWPSKDAFYKRYRHHNTYRKFTDDAFENYMQHGLIKSGDNWKLAFSPEWEAHIFQKVEFIWKYLPLIQIPTLFIKAQFSNLYSQQVFQKQNKKLSNKYVTSIEVADTYHLMPLEEPQICSEIINNWLV